MRPLSIKKQKNEEKLNKKYKKVAIVMLKILQFALYYGKMLYVVKYFGGFANENRPLSQ